MKINTEHGRHLLYKGPVENAKNNTRTVVSEALNKPPKNPVKDTFTKYDYKGSVFDKKI